MKIKGFLCSPIELGIVNWTLESMRRKSPGAYVSWSDACRLLIHAGFESTQSAATLRKIVAKHGKTAEVGKKKRRSVTLRNLTAQAARTGKKHGKARRAAS